MGIRTDRSAVELQVTEERNAPGDGGTSRARDTKEVTSVFPDDSRTPASRTSPTTRVVHVNDRIEGAVYVGRRARFRPDLPHSKWHNPFGVKRHGRDGAIFLFRQGLIHTGSIPLIQDLPELRNRPLACWCRHDGEERTEANACHADVLVDLLNRYTDDELREMAVQS